MVELQRDELVFSFPEVHSGARLRIQFQRTLRIPDDGRNYPLPPGLGPFPLRHVDDHTAEVPEAWVRHGGVMLPMYQSEALWLLFHSDRVSGLAYPFSVKVATGKTNAVTAQAWSDGLNGDPQDYLVAPDQPWLDGYCVEKGYIRQFVAMPLGAGYTIEEQVTGQAEHGGIQLAVYPMKRSRFEELAKRQRKRQAAPNVDYCMEEPCAMDMGLGMGGRMRQEVYEDRYGLEAWEGGACGRCFVHLAHSLAWRQVTGGNPPTAPLTSREYTEAGLPWFEYYAEDLKALDGSAVLAGLKSVATLGKEEGDVPLPENASVAPKVVVRLGEGAHVVREGEF